MLNISTWRTVAHKLFHLLIEKEIPHMGHVTQEQLQTNITEGIAIVLELLNRAHLGDIIINAAHAFPR